VIVGLKEKAGPLSYSYGDFTFRVGEKKEVDEETGRYLLATGLFDVHEPTERVHGEPIERGGLPENEGAEAQKDRAVARKARSR